MSVALIDDQRLVREGIAGLLALSDAVEVIAQADDGSEAVALVSAHTPDVVLMDMRMPRMSGSDAIAALRAAGF
ncbi:MAG: response regulator, partial [Pseudomonadota bacterium]